MSNHPENPEFGVLGFDGHVPHMSISHDGPPSRTVGRTCPPHVRTAPRPRNGRFRCGRTCISHVRPPRRARAPWSRWLTTQPTLRAPPRAWPEPSGVGTAFRLARWAVPSWERHLALRGRSSQDPFGLGTAFRLERRRRRRPHLSKRDAVPNGRLVASRHLFKRNAVSAWHCGARGGRSGVVRPAPPSPRTRVLSRALRPAWGGFTDNCASRRFDFVYALVDGLPSLPDSQLSVNRACAPKRAPAGQRWWGRLSHLLVLDDDGAATDKGNGVFDSTKRDAVPTLHAMKGEAIAPRHFSKVRK